MLLAALHSDLAVLLVLTIVSPSADVADAAELSLSRDGTSDYVIVLPDAPTVVERTAADELQTHFAQMTGATLPIRTEAEAGLADRRIVLGNGALTRRLAPAFDPNRAAPDTIVIKTAGRDLVLAGHPRRGTLYAVYTFLEDTLGVRWWTQTETHIPRRPTVSVPPLDIVYAPPVQDRATRYLELSDGCFTDHSLVTASEQQAMGVFSARLRLNGHDHYSIPDGYGGPNGLIGWVHTFYQINGLLPPSKYFADHPEWYSLVAGRRKQQYSQLCLTNDQMLAEMVRVVDQRIRANPGATMISISQNDWKGNCECDRCAALDRHEGTPAGSLIHFINKVAEQVERTHPGILIETLAYQYTRKPPKDVRPRHNVVIRLCSIECSFSEPLADSRDSANIAFRRDLEGWRGLASRLYVWDYVTNFSDYLAPHPNFHVLAPNLRYFVDCGAIGIFEQGDSGCRVGDFVRLRAWYLAHLLWNPRADEGRLIDEFMQGYYGAAAPYLIQYIQRMSAAGQRAAVPIRCFMPDTRGWLTRTDIDAAVRLFESAAAAVGDDPLLAQRVRRERLPLDCVRLRRYQALLDEARRTGTELLGLQDPDQALVEFCGLLERHHAGEYRQGRRISNDFAAGFTFR